MVKLTSSGSVSRRFSALDNLRVVARRLLFFFLLTFEFEVLAT